MNYREHKYLGELIGNFMVIDYNKTTRKYVCKCNCGKVFEATTTNMLRQKTCGCGRVEHMKKIIHNNTGCINKNKKHITYSKRDNIYFVRILNKYYGSFKTLEEAEKRRDEILQELEKTY